MRGKIVKGIGGFYYVHDGKSMLVECRARGGFRNRDQKPLVGDDVLFSLTEEDPGSGRIDELLPRRSELIRPAVANADQALIIVSVQKPAFHPGLLDRFLLWMNWQALPVIIGIGKTDLDEEDKEPAIRRIYEGAGCRVCSFSAKTGRGLEELKEALREKTTVLAGASGVGKSTLLNALMPEAAMETGELSKKLGRGRHTTRHAEIFCWAPDSFLCDTPGFSSLDLPPIEADQLRHCFAEFEEAGTRCAFRDCLHSREKGCAVRAAAEAGSIPESRYESYLRFLEELKARKPY